MANTIQSRIDQVRIYSAATSGQIFSLRTGLPLDLTRRRLYVGFFINPNDSATGPLTDYSVSGDIIFSASGTETFRLPLEFTHARSGAQATDWVPSTNSILPPWTVSRVDRATGATLQDLDMQGGEGDVVSFWDVTEGATNWTVGMKCSPMRVSCSADQVTWSGSLVTPAVGTFAAGLFLAVQSEGRV